MDTTYVRIALRNLNRQRKRTIILAGAIAFGILIVTLINGFAGSFVENVSENFSQLLAGHIFIDGVEKTEDRELTLVRNDKILIDTITEAGLPVRYLSRTSEFRGTLFFQGNSVNQQVLGIDFNEASQLKERLIPADGSFDNMDDPTGLIITSDIADVLKTEIGDTILVRLKTIYGQQNVGEFRLAAIVHDPNFFGSLSAYGNLEYVNELLSLKENEYQTLGIFLDKLELADPETEKLYAALQDKVDLFERNPDSEKNLFESFVSQTDDEEWDGIRYRIYNINDILSEVEQIVRLLNQVALIILLILFVIIMVGINNTFRIIMHERVKEIGTMRAIGIQRSGVVRLFLYEALFLSLGGVLAGILTAGIIMFVLSLINWGLDSPIYILLKNGYMTFKLVPLQLIMNMTIVAALSLSAAYFPARKAALMLPVDALRAN